ncbi:MAG TPA: ion transporter [Stellaceae bacterium]|nr:ion transporter [Stellaceae bacterium]
MDRQHLYRLLQPGNSEPRALLWRVVHHSMVAAGIGIMLALTVVEMQSAYGDLLSDTFDVIALFFVLDYLLRLYAAPGAPGGEHRGAWRARLSWATSLGGVVDLMAAIPGLIALPDSRDATLIGFIWVFKYVRYSSGLSILERVIANARHALLSVLLGLIIVLLAAASVAYLLERNTDPAFSSIPAALWWAIVTLTTTGYGDVVPHTLAGRMLAGVVMVCGIMVFALMAGILATGYAEEMRRREFLRTWELVAKVPFFHNLGAVLIAEVARLLRVRDYPANAAIVRRGEPGD